MGRTMDNHSHNEGESMNSADFRKELMKIMPGYKWTVHKTSNPNGFQSATGIQSSGFNRLSTLRVTRREKDGIVTYEAKSAPYGGRPRWAHTNTDGSLARALRGLQDHYERQANYFRSLASYLNSARKPSEGDPA